MALAGAIVLLLCGITAVTSANFGVIQENDAVSHQSKEDSVPLIKTDAQWKQCLTPVQYRVLRHKDTEVAFTGEYWNTKAQGIYHCAGCGQPLFGSDAKFDSGTGWPSFRAPYVAGSVATESDDSLHMRRTEVLCSHCGGHLGHVFPDGPAPTGLRYCINSAALKLDKSESPQHSITEERVP
jgi:peptide-methionine (R)-S-oxide reductase